MSAPAHFVEWLQGNSQTTKQGHRVQYNSRNDAHSRSLSQFILQDLVHRCIELQHLLRDRTLACAVEVYHRWPNGAQKKLDFAIGIPNESARNYLYTIGDICWVIPPKGRCKDLVFHHVLISGEAKSMFTAHSKAYPRLHDELRSAYHQIQNVTTHDVAVINNRTQNNNAITTLDNIWIQNNDRHGDVNHRNDRDGGNSGDGQEMIDIRDYTVCNQHEPSGPVRVNNVDARFTVATGIVVINASTRFQSSLRKKGQVGTQKLKTIQKCVTRIVNNIPVRTNTHNEGFDALGIIGVNCTNKIGGHVTLSKRLQIPPTHQYDAFLNTILNTFRSRYSHLFTTSSTAAALSDVAQNKDECKDGLTNGYLMMSNQGDGSSQNEMVHNVEKTAIYSR